MRAERHRTRAIAAAALAAATLLACISAPISVQFDREEDFSALRRFAWYPSRTPTQTEKRRRFPEQFAAADRAVEMRLMERGYQKVPLEAADFLVLCQLSLERRFDTRTVNEPYRMHGSEWEVHRVVTREETIEYKRGTVLVDVLDARSRRLVWRGSSSSRLDVDQVPTPERVEKRVSEILAKFPPKP